MLLRPGGSEHLVEPVMLLPVPYRIERCPVELSDIGLVVDILPCTEHLWTFPERLSHEPEVIAHMRSPAVALSALRGNQDYSVGTLGSVKGGRGGILQYLHRLYKRRVEIAEVFDPEAVDDDKRILSGGIGIAAHTDYCGRARGSGGIEYLHAGEASLKGGRGIGIG